MDRDKFDRWADIWLAFWLGVLFGFSVVMLLVGG